MGIYEFILKAISDYTNIELVVNTLRSLIYGVFILIFLAVFLHQVSGNLLRGKGLIINWPEFVRIIMLAILFSTYNNSVGALSRFIDDFNMSASKVLKVNNTEYVKIEFVRFVKNSDFQFTEQERNDLIDRASTSAIDNKIILKKAVQQVRKRQNTEIGDKVISGVNDVFIGVKGTFSKMWHSLIFSIQGGIKLVMSIFILGLDKILYCFGILAITASLMPIWKDKFATWLGTWIVVKLSFLSMLVLDMVIKKIIMGGYNIENLDIGGDFIEYGISLTSLILYILIFWLTSRYIGSGEAGKVLSTAMATASTIMGARIATMMSKGGSAAIGGASSVGGNIATSGVNMANNSLQKKPGEK